MPRDEAELSRNLDHRIVRCCARSASGHVAAPPATALPIAAMKSRRRILVPWRRFNRAYRGRRHAGTESIKWPVFVALHESGSGSPRRLVRCSDMSEVEVKADSKSMTPFGRK